MVSADPLCRLACLKESSSEAIVTPMTATVDALGTDDLTTVGIVVTVVLILIGLVLSMLITALIGRAIIAVVVIVLAILVWQQRSHVEDNLNKHACNLGTTYFGVHIDPPRSVRDYCTTHTQ